MHHVVIPLEERRAFGETMRRDAWWGQPLLTFVVLAAFVVYATWAAFQGEHYEFGPYLSPFYSPCLGDCVEGASDFGQPFGWWPLSAALIILIFPLGFRMTCYYYRKAYYRAFWMSPPACGVAEPHQSYSGESRLPLVLQNVHRYFWYAAVVVGLVLTFDVVLAFRPMPAEYAVGDGETSDPEIDLVDRPSLPGRDATGIHPSVPLLRDSGRIIMVLLDPESGAVQSLDSPAWRTYDSTPTTNP